MLVLNTGTDILGTPISDATFVASVPTTDYAHFEIVLFDNRAHFAIYTQGGTLVNAQDLEFSGTGTAHFSQTRLQAMHRVYNSGAAGAAVQMLVHGTVVVGMDSLSQRDWRSSLSGNSLNSLTSPTAYTQLANWTNSGAPTTRTLSNTAAAETTLGGILRANSIAGGTTDLIMFGWQNGTVSTGPVFYCTGIYISVPMNEVVAVATTATVFSYFAAFNSSAVSLATAAPTRPSVSRYLAYTRLPWPPRPTRCFLETPSCGHLLLRCRSIQAGSYMLAAASSLAPRPPRKPIIGTSPSTVTLNEPLNRRYVRRVRYYRYGRDCDQFRLR